MFFNKSEPLITNETFDAFEKSSSKIELLTYFTTTRNIVTVLESMVENEPLHSSLKQQLSDFCKERKEFLQRNGYGIIHHDQYAKFRANSNE